MPDPVKKIEAPQLIKVRRRHEFRVEQDGTEVILLLDGRLVFKADGDGALLVGQNIVEAALRARAMKRLAAARS